MQITIGTKIFGIAIVLSAMMIIAAVLSENRVRQAQVQVDVLIDEMIPLLELSAELKFLALHEQFEVSDHSTWAEVDGAEKQAVLKDEVEGWASSFNSTAENMRSALRIAITTLPSVDRKLALEKLDSQLASLVTEHDTLVETGSSVIIRASTETGAHLIYDWDCGYVEGEDFPEPDVTR